MGRKFCVKPIFLGCHGQKRDEQGIYVARGNFVKSCKGPTPIGFNRNDPELTI